MLCTALMCTLKSEWGISKLNVLQLIDNNQFLMHKYKALHNQIFLARIL